jgi:multidrug efflux pump
MTALELTDYARRYLEDRFSVLDGRCPGRISGQQVYSMRIWLDRNALVARDLTVTDVEDALRTQNVELPAGTIKSVNSAISWCASIAAFKPWRTSGAGAGPRRGRLPGASRRCGAGRAGSAETRSLFAATRSPWWASASSSRARPTTWRWRGWPGRKSRFSTGSCPDRDAPGGPGYDRSVFVEAAIDEVYSTLFIAATLVVLVIFLFLGDPRSVLVPALTVPISLIGSFSLLWAVRLQHQPADAAGPGAGHRPGGGRQHRGTGKHPPPPGARRDRPGGFLARFPAGGFRGAGHHAGAGRGIPADHLPRGQYRAPVRRVRRGHGHRRGDSPASWP